MNRKHGFFRHIGLAFVVMMALIPFILVDAQDVPREKTLIIGFEGGPVAAPENMGVSNAAVFGQGTQQTMMESLYILNYQTGEAVPWLASGPEKWNADFTQVDIPLREGITWNDGVAFTADDVVFSINMDIAHPTLQFAGPVAQEVKEVTAVDPLTVRMTLNSPDPRFIYNNFSVKIWGGVRIVPEHIWKDQDPETFTNFDLAKGWPVWSGPYKLIKASATEFVFDRDPNWWGAKTGFQNLPAPERVIFVDAGPADRAAAALSDNEVDGQPSLRTDLFPAVQAQNPDVIGWTKTGSGAWIDPCPGMLGFNTTVAPWNDAEMRWAISYALPKQKIADAGSGGAGELSPYNFPDYPALQSWLTENADLLKQYDSTVFDADKAKSIIESKGYAMGDDGFYAKDGAHLTVNLLVKTADTIVTPIIISSLQDVGIDAQPRALADAPYFQARNVGDFEIETTHVDCGSVTEPYAELLTLASRMSAPIGEVASQNIWRYENPEYDKIVDQIGALPANDPQEHALFRQALEIRLKDLPIISLSQQLRIVPYSTKYWTNWPTADNGYVHPPNWWQTFIIPLVNIKPAGSS